MLNAWNETEWMVLSLGMCGVCAWFSNKQMRSTLVPIYNKTFRNSKRLLAEWVSEPNKT